MAGVEKLNVHSIFESVSGEAGGILFPQGTWCSFIRLQGCNLRCAWCDTTSSQDYKQIGKLMSPEEVVDACGNLKHILITGGEPMLQARELVPVIRLLLEKDCQIQIETNGSLRLPPQEFGELPSLCGTSWVIDYKCPSSGMVERMPDLGTLAAWLFLIKIHGGLSRIKWVVKDNTDLDFALAKIEELIYMHKEHAHIGMDTKHLISPLDGNGNRILEITEQIKRRNKDILNHIIFSVQLHKIFGLA